MTSKLQRSKLYPDDLMTLTYAIPLPTHSLLSLVQVHYKQCGYNAISSSFRSVWQQHKQTKHTCTKTEKLEASACLPIAEPLLLITVSWGCIWPFSLEWSGGLSSQVKKIGNRGVEREIDGWDCELEGEERGAQGFFFFPSPKLDKKRDPWNSRQSADWAALDPSLWR